MPLTVLRRLDCVLEATKPAVLEKHAAVKGSIDNIDPILCAVAGEQFFNTSPLDVKRLLDDLSQLASNLRAYIAGFSESFASPSMAAVAASKQHGYTGAGKATKNGWTFWRYTGEDGTTKPLNEFRSGSPLPE